MSNLNTELPVRSWRRIRRIAGTITAILVALSIIVSSLVMETMAEGISLAGMLLAISMPILLGGPMLFVLLLRQEQLHHANRQLELLATTDWLTGCRSRGAFTRQVAEYLDHRTSAGGALLVVDADNFKSVNDRFGHDLGDQALRQIADAIHTATTAASAIVGRLGGEEFGIFLPGADPILADRIAQRVRSAVAAVVFAPAGTNWPLSVSIGGAIYSARTQYSVLYRHADQRLYQAKNSGRDCVAMVQAA
jgi:diguanylate cyclase